MVKLKLSLRLATLAAVWAIGACAFDDRNLTPHDGDAGDAGDAGETSGGTGGSSGNTSGGTAGKGGSTTGGSAGKGGSTTGGSAGKGGATTGGTSGTGGSGALGGVEDCDGDPLEVDEDLVRACLMQIGCNPFVPGVSLSFCITNQRLNTFSQDDCGTDAATCDDYLDCRGQGYYDPADGCATGEPVFCESATLGVSCARYPYAIDCAKFGGTCATYTDDTDALRVWCEVPGHDACTEPAGMKQCDAAGISYECIDGVAFGNDCDAIGSECRDGSCFYVLPTCTTPGVTCGTATRLDVCYESQDLARYQCAPGLGCEETSTNADCLAPGCTANSPCAESCDGTELTFCYGGVPVTLDCTDYGFLRCFESTPSAGGDTLAYCGIPETATDRACEVEDTDTTCGACAKTECCSAWTACLDSPDCNDYRSCALECDGASVCIEECGDTYPVGLVISDAFFNCRDAACGC